MSELRECPTCGGSGVVPADDPARPDQQTLSDRDQTGSDRDQTWSDQDQTASDRDTDSASDDQEASDQDFAAGGDPLVHERTRRARRRAASDRDDVSTLRDETAAERLSTAGERDRSAEARDYEAAERDRLAARSALRPDADPTEIRLQAARDRERAAADRARAAADREAAAHERDETRRALAEARRELEVAATDELTGAWTRRLGLVQIAREIERARRTGGTLTLAFVDVDGLKEVNDMHGHAVGDRLLRLVADTMQSSLRRYDVVSRYGGDEFLCAMPNLRKDAAAKRLTAIAATLSAAETGHSISFGLAEHQPAESVEELVARADADLLAARRARGERAPD
jgi:diguanylate cyclase (GGDEF)-like protein